MATKNLFQMWREAVERAHDRIPHKFSDWDKQWFEDSFAIRVLLILDKTVYDHVLDIQEQMSWQEIDKVEESLDNLEEYLKVKYGYTGSD